jgi:NAD(P)-dependent dehydrogenase (short-subunit alcohol dehydrogenase family)
MWEMACLAGFLNGREVAKRMVSKIGNIEQHASGVSQKGTIIFTGATASLRGSANFAGFSGGKMALRGLAQSMARELGPMGIHVAHTIIDGAIDTEFIRTLFPERYALKDQGGILNPDHIADAYWMLHQRISPIFHRVIYLLVRAVIPLGGVIVLVLIPLLLAALHMLVSSRTASTEDKVLLLLLMEINTLENGKITGTTDKVLCMDQMD